MVGTILLELSWTPLSLISAVCGSSDSEVCASESLIQETEGLVAWVIWFVASVIRWLWFFLVNCQYNIRRLFGGPLLAAKLISSMRV